MKSKLLIIILIIILLVVYAYFGIDYMKQRNEQEALSLQIAEVTEVLGEMPKPSQDIEQRLEAAQTSLAAEQSVFPSKMNSTQVINTILELADDCQVKAIPLVTQPWSIENIGEHGYYVFRLNVAVEGSFSKLVSFVSKLENGEFKTLIVENVSVTRDPEESVSGGTISVVAILDLAIYARLSD